MEPKLPQNRLYALGIFLDQAVPAAYSFSDEGDIILLSPANASWDQFKTFEERGDRYIQDVEQLTHKEEGQQ